MFFNTNNAGSYLFRNGRLKKSKGITLIELMIYIAILSIFIAVFDFSYKGIKKIEEENYKEELKKETHSLLAYGTYFCKINNQAGKIIFYSDRIIFKAESETKKEIKMRKGYTGSFNTGSVENVMIINNNGKIYTAGTVTILCPNTEKILMSISVDNSYVKVK